MYADRTARAVGDLVTVLIEEHLEDGYSRNSHLKADGKVYGMNYEMCNVFLDWIDAGYCNVRVEY